MKNTKVTLLDYGAGNIGSVLNIFNLLGFSSRISASGTEVVESDFLIIPGVGSAGNAINNLSKLHLIEALNERNSLNKPILGICLGAQLMHEYLEEGETRGLCWIDGTVSRISNNKFMNTGWSSLQFSKLKALSLSRGITADSTFYFNHNYVMPNNSLQVKTVFSEGDLSVPAIFIRNNLVGIQFHPEKSQTSGHRILRNVLMDYYGL